jgi:DNA-binding transcriptional MerR regulator
MRWIDDKTLAGIEKKHSAGFTSADLLDVFARHGVQVSEATLRKYVQLGLLPRSVRVGTKGKHLGSRGVYPVGVIRQILRIKEMLTENYTMEEIQRDFLFMRSDMEQLEQTLKSIFSTLTSVVSQRQSESYAKVVAQDVDGALALSRDLVTRLGAIENRLTSRSRLRQVSAS